MDEDYGILEALEDLDELESELMANTRLETVNRVRGLLQEIEKTGLVIGDDR